MSGKQLDCARDPRARIQRSALAGLGSGDLGLARDVLSNALELHGYRSASDLTGGELPVWVLEIQPVRGERKLLAKYVEAGYGEDVRYLAPALTADEAFAAAHLLADHPEAWADEIVNACIEAKHGWRPGDRSEVAA